MDFFTLYYINKECLMKIDIKSMPLEALEHYIDELGEKTFRAKQLYEWMHVHKVCGYEEMTNLPKSFRRKLSEETVFTCLRMAERQVSAIDGTRKYLFALDDGNMVESVLMKYKHGNSVCVSSQVGCRMGCRFCASTLDGLERNLTPAEMLDQIYRIERDLGERVSNVVVMGTGEPLDNYENLLVFLRMLTDEHGCHISQRSVTVSTCGLVPKIRSLAEERLQITLALSLHASNQKKREELMPVAKTYDLSQVMEACRYYHEMTGRRMTYEYSLVAGVNDSVQQAKELAQLLQGMGAHVNLIPVNPIKERTFAASGRSAVLEFQKYLAKYGINVTIRREMGADIDGACGQLRRRYKERYQP